MECSNQSLEQRLAALHADRLAGMRRGIEKESLRVDADGSLALTPHPATLGSALTHPSITTDYSESQLELITAPHASAEDCLREISEIHHFVYRELAARGDERLWVSSMPCGLPTDETIPIGRYGTSHVGRAKSVYRMGLGHRYGRRMQTISGIHYNWSLPGLSDADYFGLIRNFRRQSFLLLVLFGASPALCGSFVAGRQHGLQPIGDATHTLFLPHATSLRMGRLGYQSDAQAALNVSYNCLAGYAASLHGALTTPFPPYEAIGVMNPGGEYNQLSTSLLQIENEFYGTIRPKRSIKVGERPLRALRERGVEYVEVRCMDLDPFEPVGIAAPTMRFLDIFLLHCLLKDSPDDTPQEIAALSRNQQRTASAGREPGLMLERDGGTVALVDWGREIIAECEPIAERLDHEERSESHVQALADARARLEDLDLTPSARVLATIRADFGNSYTRFVRAQGEQSRRLLLDRPFSRGLADKYRVQAEVSLREQRRREQADTGSFEEFRQHYLSADQLIV